MDAVFIENLELAVRIGCKAPEREQPQRVLLTCHVISDMTAAIESGQVYDTVCYLTIAALAREVLESREWVLLEQAGSSLIGSIFNTFAKAQEVRLVLKKFVVQGAGSSGIELVRKRAKS